MITPTVLCIWDFLSVVCNDPDFAVSQRSKMTRDTCANAWRENCASVRRCRPWGRECTVTQNVHMDWGVLMCFRAVNTADSQLQVSWALCGGLVACWQSQSLRITFPLRLSVTPPQTERQTHQRADGKRTQFRAIFFPPLLDSILFTHRRMKSSSVQLKVFS